MATFDWDSNDYQADDRDYTPVPAGVYRLKATNAEQKATRTGGEMIAVTFQIAEGQFKGRLIWHNFNVVNKSAQAERIGRSQVEAWKKAAGKPNAGSTDQLLDAPFFARVSIEEQPGYNPRNRIDGFKFDAEAAAEIKPSAPAEVKPAPRSAAPAAKPAAAPAKPAAGGQKNPWED